MVRWFALDAPPPQRRRHRRGRPARAPFRDGREPLADEQDWPPRRARRRRSICAASGREQPRGDGWLSPLPPGEEPPDTFVYDPANRSRRGGVRLARLRVPVDRREIEERADVLVYTSTAAGAGGRGDRAGAAVLLGGIDVANDTDWTAKLVDVQPERHGPEPDRRHPARPLPPRPGRRRAAHARRDRALRSRSTSAPPSNVFLPGHRIRVEIRAATSHASTATPIPVRRSVPLTPPPWWRGRRSSTTAPRGPPRPAGDATMSAFRARSPLLGALALIGGAIAACSTPAPSAPASRTLLGYAPAGSATELALERRFQDGVSAESMSTLHEPLAGARIRRLGRHHPGRRVLRTR